MPSSRQVVDTAARLACTQAQVALAWQLRLRPNVLQIPGTSSAAHREENVAAASIELDDEAQAQVASVQHRRPRARLE